MAAGKNRNKQYGYSIKALSLACIDTPAGICLIIRNTIAVVNPCNGDDVICKQNLAVFFCNY